MAEVNVNNLKFGLRDVIYLVSLVLALATNYYANKGAQTDSNLIQAKYNAVYDLKLEALGVQVGKLEIEIDKLKEKH